MMFASLYVTFSGGVKLSGHMQSEKETSNICVIRVDYESFLKTKYDQNSYTQLLIFINRYAMFSSLPLPYKPHSVDLNPNEVIHSSF